MSLGLYEQRRQAIANEVSTLWKRPRTLANKSQIDALIREDDDLQRGVDHDLENRAMATFRDGFLRGRNYDRNLLKELPRTEVRNLGELGAATGGATAGGVLVPLGFASQVYAAQKLTGPMLSSDVVTTFDTPTGTNFSMPEINDTASTGYLVPEGVQTPMQDIPTFSQRVMGAYKYSSGIVLASMEMVQDIAFPIDGFLARCFGIRLARVANTALTLGTGTGGQPLGIVTAALAESNSTVTATGSVSDDGVGGFNTIGTNDLINLMAAVDQVYLNSEKCAFMMHQQTLKFLRTLKNKQGGFAILGLHDSPDRIMGIRVVVNNNMDQLQATSSSPAVTRNTVLFGDFGQWVTRRTPQQMYVLLERFIDIGIHGFFLTQRYDGALLDAGAGAIRVLQNIG